MPVESFFNKAAGLLACNFIKKRLQYRCFPVNIVKFLRTTYFIEHLQWLLLQVLYKKAIKLFLQTSLERIAIGVLFWPRTCNFMKIEGPVQLFCCEFCEISQNNIMQNSGCSWTLRGVAENKCS